MRPTGWSQEPAPLVGLADVPADGPEPTRPTRRARPTRMDGRLLKQMISASAASGRPEVAALLLRGKGVIHLAQVRQRQGRSAGGRARVEGLRRAPGGAVKRRHLVPGSM